MAKKNYDDLHGLDDWGGGMDEMWGAVAGGGVSTAVAMGVRMASADPALRKFSEGIGALAGLATGAVMYFATQHQAAGKTAMAVAAVTGGLRQLETFLTGGLNGFGLPTIEPTKVLRGGGFGIATIEPTTAFQGFGSAPQLVGPPQLVGADAGIGNMPGAQQVRLNGGPGISGLAGAYGATLFG